MKNETALSILWASCRHNERTIEAYYVIKRLMEERPHGEWVEVDIKPLPYGGYTCNYQCNKCNYFTKEYHLNFCPNCGADMRPKEGEAK